MSIVDGTLTENMMELQRKGFSSPYGVRDGMLLDLTSGDTFDPEKFQVVTMREFTHEEEAEATSELYAIAHTEKDEKGLFLRAHRAAPLPGVEKVVSILVS